MSVSLNSFLDEHSFESPFGAAFAEATLFTSTQSDLSLLNVAGASPAELELWSHEISLPLHKDDGDADEASVAASPAPATLPQPSPTLPPVAAAPARRLLSVQKKGTQRRVLPGTGAGHVVDMACSITCIQHIWCRNALLRSPKAAQAAQAD